MAQVIGQSLKRQEDIRLIRGQGQYTDDIKLPGMLYAYILRSPYAHAKILSIDTTVAKTMPGVVAIFTGNDLKDEVGLIPTAWIPPDSDLQVPPHPALAYDEVHYQGDGVAVIIAESPYQAQDAAFNISVQYQPLPVVTDPRDAVRDQAPLVHPEIAHNIAFHWRVGDNLDDVFAQADVVIKQQFRQQRLIPSAMEPRCAVADYHGATGELTLWATTQNPHIHRLLMSGILGIPEHKLRVIAIDVGGAFGSKISCYPDEVIVSWASKKLHRPVKWTETRQENFLVTTHGRDHVEEVELAGTRDGQIQAIRVKVYANMGAYLSTAAPGVPTILFGLIINGAYKIAHASSEVFGVLTHTTPVDAYRGAGRPEATFLIERMVDLYALAIQRDPLDVRKKNLIQPDEFPFTNPFGLEYDSGNYQATLDKALQIFNYEEFRRDQENLRKQGKYIGVGFSTYVEMCGLGPSEVAGAVGFQGGLWESATVRVHPTGKVSVFTGASPHGQGEETTFAQIVAEELGIAIDDIEVIHGDTAQIAMGWGTYGSRTTAVGGAAIHMANQKVIEKARKIAAHKLEVNDDDVVFDKGVFMVKGLPARSIRFQEVALDAYLAWNLPPGIEPALEGTAFYNPKNFTYPFGVHVAVVSVDTDTGDITLLRYIAVDDVGKIINPMIVEGQVHGGLVQGIGQALWEGAEFDNQGQLMTGSFLDYTVPKARFFPNFETAHTETPSPHNPLGVKGVGETGAIASTPAIVNAVMDALRPFNILDLPMPLTSRKVWNAIRQAQLSS
ncbi:xanthine dehydrogenase family protein molybdopterin-binding subunit [Sulfobacillus thermosulfidooxidans]|uniref:xanthine dehydrogenase family protein molybdopterin-binding subunit n=1 Tax=Sulfobacillus thermosulfidooxidans TaxID=28034 RepID=UPI00096BCEA2|nr:molybdopterin cofactor-binding domain-containing protein [Sulfobacillus thermosulfidooxidans]OLZ08339.1 carbon monoxide dehydrogenase [Sulfobacillus thermosulfidooxidans]OLZ13939.1 carbon monoxide dehydrogenase [Sulfobacillus thermosulfidooxidans]OLZ20557.1 carbon monoxide dehydrogenase [Sulfobacillus thermosulfidooxidans]